MCRMLAENYLKNAQWVTTRSPVALSTWPITHCSRSPACRSHSVRASFAGISRAPRASCAPNARPCDGGNWSGASRGH